MNEKPNLSELVTILDDERAIIHYGVKGMKWGKKKGWYKVKKQKPRSFEEAKSGKTSYSVSYEYRNEEGLENRGIPTTQKSVGDIADDIVKQLSTEGKRISSAAKAKLEKLLNVSSKSIRNAQKTFGDKVDDLLEKISGVRPKEWTKRVVKVEPDTSRLGKLLNIQKVTYKTDPKPLSEFIKKKK